MSQPQQQNLPPIFKIFSPKRVIWIILISIGVVGFLFFKDFDKEYDGLISIQWTGEAIFWLLMAVMMAVLRHLAYMYRIRYLSGNTFSWLTAYQVIMLWEFASAATPSIVGGTAVALFLLAKEGMSTGKSTTIVLYTVLLDELFFILATPLFFVIGGWDAIFPDPELMSNERYNSTYAITIFFAAGYVVLLVYTLSIAYGLFINPKGFKWLLTKIFSLRILRRWQKGVTKTGEEIIIASAELKQKNFNYWMHASGATIISWLARFFTVNCVLMAIGVVDSHFIVLGRQCVMWVIMLLPTLPGAAGVAELVFSEFLREFIPSGATSTAALIWRVISYYPYLFIGLIVLQRWLRKVYPKQDTPSEPPEQEPPQADKSKAPETIKN